MPRELRIMATITLPDDPFDQAEAMMKYRPVVQQMREAFGAESVQMEQGEAERARTRKPRQPRAAKTEAPTLAAVA